MSTPSPSESPPVPSVDPLARGLSPEELADIAAKAGRGVDQKRAEPDGAGRGPVAPQPVRWGPLDKAALLALRYIGDTHVAGTKRIEAMEAEERAAHADRLSELVEAVAGRKPPLLEGHDLGFQADKTGNVYLVAFPQQQKG